MLNTELFPMPTLSWVNVSESGSQLSDISNGSDCYSISNNSLAPRKRSPFPKQYHLSCLTPHGLVTKKSWTTSFDIGDIGSQISDATPCTFSSKPTTIINVDFQVDSLLPLGLHLHYLLDIESHYDIDDKNPFVISCLFFIQHRLKRQHSNYESKTPEFQKEVIKSSILFWIISYDMKLKCFISKNNHYMQCTMISFKEQVDLLCDCLYNHISKSNVKSLQLHSNSLHNYEQYTIAIYMHPVLSVAWNQAFFHCTKFALDNFPLSPIFDCQLQLSLLIHGWIRRTDCSIFETICISREQLHPIGQVSSIIPLRTALDKYLPRCMMNQRRCTARSHSQDQPRNHFPNDM